MDFILDFPVFPQSAGSLEGYVASKIGHDRRRFGGPSGIGKGESMTTRRDRQFVKVQLQEMQRLKEVTVGHPLMSHALSIREKELIEQLQALPLGGKEPRAVLFFTGDPVTDRLGSMRPLQVA